MTGPSRWLEERGGAMQRLPLVAPLALLALISVVFLDGCGFHLQGRAPLPTRFAHTYIDTDDRQSDFIQGLNRSLTTAGATLEPTAASASAIIHVSRDQLEQRVLSVSSRNVPQEYELIYHVRFSVDGGDQELLASNEVSTTRDYTFDETQVLAKQREQEILRADLARDLVALVMRRISSL